MIMWKNMDGQIEATDDNVEKYGRSNRGHR
jgi:hypothetical protein